jgi:hypothetical protein
MIYTFIFSLKMNLGQIFKKNFDAKILRDKSGIHFESR